MSELIQKEPEPRAMCVQEIQLTPNGAVITGRPTEDSIDLAMSDIARHNRGLLLGLGDLINYSEATFGDKYSRWVELTGMHQGTLRNIASTCKQVPFSMRRSGTLSFDHHRAVKSLPPADQERWLDTAEKESLPVKRLRQSIAHDRVLSVTEAKTLADAQKEAGYPNVQPHVNSIVIFQGGLRRDGVLASLDDEGVYEMHRDLLPVLECYSEILDRPAGSPLGADVAGRIKHELQALGLASNHQPAVIH